MDQIVNEIRRELLEQADPKVRASGQRFFKEEVRLYGFKSVRVGEIAKQFYKRQGAVSKPDLYARCEGLFSSGYLEESIIACIWTQNIAKKYTPDDFTIFERWIGNYVTNWAVCDTFCNHTVGTFITTYPEFITNFKLWAVSPNLWMRRAAAVSLIVPARRGRFLPEIFEIATILLSDTEDMVQKGYGWMLKEAGKLHRDEVFNFVMTHKTKMPRTALRYAIEKMPPDMRARAMAR